MLAADVSARSLKIAARRIGLDRMTDTQRSRISLLPASLVYTDDRLAELDAAVPMEGASTPDESRLARARCVFGAARPGTVIVTTPNVERDVRYEALPAGVTGTAIAGSGGPGRVRRRRFIQDLPAGVTARLGLRIGRVDGQVGVPIIGQLTALHLVELVGRLGTLGAVEGELPIALHPEVGAAGADGANCSWTRSGTTKDWSAWKPKKRFAAASSSDPKAPPWAEW
ncbi:MAG TPA: hypothetical protein VIT65_28485 [Microlunatus sp.]